MPKAEKVFWESETVTAIARGFSTSEVNAGMGENCCCPTVGGAGILPEVCHGCKKDLIFPTKRCRKHF